MRAMGSWAASSASSSSVRYLDWVSADEWEYGRVTSTWRRAGPTPARMWAMALAPRLRTFQ